MNVDLQAGKSAYEIVEEDHFVSMRVLPGKTITADLILSMLADLYSREAYRSETEGGLWVFADCPVDMSYPDMQRIMEFIKTHYDPNWSHRYTAMVVDKDTQYGFARMYDAMADQVPTEVEIFREEQPARDWLRSKAGGSALSS